MKLAEALLLRGEMQTRLAKLRERLGRCVLVQEGDKPAEDPEKLMGQGAGLISDLYALVARINRTNQSAKMLDGRTMMEAIAERDRLRQTLSLVQFAAQSAAGPATDNRYSLREIRWVPMMSVQKLHAQSDDISQAQRELNAKVQEANWKIELLD